MSVETIEDIKKLPWMPIEAKDGISKKPAVYFVLSEGTLLYVGISINPKARWQRHHRFDDFIKKPNPCVHLLFPEGLPAVSKKTKGIIFKSLSELEKAFIERFDPLLNIQNSNRASPLVSNKGGTRKASEQDMWLGSYMIASFDPFWLYFRWSAEEEPDYLTKMGESNFNKFKEACEESEKRPSFELESRSPLDLEKRRFKDRDYKLMVLYKWAKKLISPKLACEYFWATLNDGVVGNHLDCLEDDGYRFPFEERGRCYPYFWLRFNKDRLTYVSDAIKQAREIGVYPTELASLLYLVVEISICHEDDVDERCVESTINDKLAHYENAWKAKRL